MSLFDVLRFQKEIVPHDIVIKDWLRKCEPELLPSVERDYRRIRDEIFLGKTSATQNKLYLATAGAPCSGKSTEFDFELESGRDPRYSNIVVVDPDRYTMEYMMTYRNLLSASKRALSGPERAAIDAYNRARPGSNLISNTNLNKAFDGDFNIAHGTTLTAPTVGRSLERLGEDGYERRLLLCNTSDEVRLSALNKRIHVDGQYQVDPGDFINKGKAFPQRHGDYFANGDHLILLWKEEVEKPAIRAAAYKDGRTVVLDALAFKSYTQKYEQDRQTLARENITIPAWIELERKFVDRFDNPSRRRSPAGPKSGPVAPQ